MRNIYSISLAVVAGWLVLAGCSQPPGEREFKAGLRELNRGEAVRAKAQFERSIDQRAGSEENAEAYNFLGIANLQLNKTAEAIQAFEESRRLDPDYLEPVYNLGVALADSGDMPGAVSALNEAARLDPKDTRALEYLAHLFSSRQQWPEARRSLYAALDRDPQSPRIHTAIAVVEASADSPERAVNSLMKALETNSKYGPALFNLAQLYEKKLAQPAQAEAYYEKFIDVARKDPNAANARAAIARIQAAAEAQTTAPARDQDDVPDLAPVTQSVITVVDNAHSQPRVVATSESSAAGAEDVLKQAASLAEKGRGDTALDLCLQVAANAERRGQAELQERALRQAVRICFDQPKAHVALGRFLLKQKQADAALKAFKQALVLDDKSVDAQIAMAEAAVQTGELDAALIGLKQAVRTDPKNAEALWTLATLYDKQLELPDKAAQSYREFAKLFASDERAAKARQRARELVPAPEEPEATAGTPAVEPPVAAPVIETAVVSNPAPVDMSGEPAPTRRIQYKKPTIRNTAAAVQAFKQGSEYQAKKGWDRAIFYYLRSLENDDLLANTFYNLGTAYTVKGDYDLSKDAYLRALDLQPSMVNARYNLALIYREQRDPVSAIRLLQDVIAAQPANAQAHYVLGYLYADNAQTIDKAKYHYDQFLKLAPNDPSARAVRQWLESR